MRLPLVSHLPQPQGRRQKVLYGLAIFAVLAVLFLFADLFFLSRSAALIFNHAMADQTMLRGTVTVERLHANVLGQVRFENLEWRDPEGGLILAVPRGSFRARAYDVLTGNLKSTTIQELMLDGAVLSLAFDDDMKLDFLRHSPALDAAEEAALEKKEREEKERSTMGSAERENMSEAELKVRGEAAREERAEVLRRRLRNFDREGKKLRLKLTLKNCRGELFYRRRHYLLQGMEVHADINTSKDVGIKGSVVGLGGTMAGNGVTLNGSVNMREAVPTADLSVLVSEVDPGSLDIGMKMRDKMTLAVRFTGPLDNLEGDGVVRIKSLNLPGIPFRNVVGNVRWQGARLDFTNVTADVFGGKFAAHGDYDLDTRYWHLYGHGEGLEATKGFPHATLDCMVALDITISSTGNSRRTEYKGSFYSGPGTYRYIVPFQSLSGSFDSAWRDLKFGDAVIDFGDGYIVRTDAIRKKDGELTIAPIEFYDAQGPRASFVWEKKKK